MKFTISEEVQEIMKKNKEIEQGSEEAKSAIVLKLHKLLVHKLLQ